MLLEHGGRGPPSVARPLRPLRLVRIRRRVSGYAQERVGVVQHCPRKKVEVTPFKVGLVKTRGRGLVPLHADVLDLPAHRPVLPRRVAARRLGGDRHLTDCIAEADPAPSPVGRSLQQVNVLLPVGLALGVAVTVGRGPDGLDWRLFGTRVLRSRA